MRLRHGPAPVRQAGSMPIRRLNLGRRLALPSDGPGRVSVRCQTTPLSWHRGCCRAAVIDVALGVLALLAGGVSLELYAAARAPLGYQDEEGFHLGTEAHNCAPDYPAGKPS